MKILQLCSARAFGGGERHLADLANSLADRGHDVYAAVVPGSPVTAHLNSLPEENIFEVKIANSLDLWAARRLARIVSRTEVDIIHAHVARDYPLAAVASRMSGHVPFVLTRHVLFPLTKLHRTTLGRAARVIGVSEAVAASVRNQQIFQPDVIETIYNGVDRRRFASDNNGSTRAAEPMDVKPPRVIGMVGHIAPIKGQEVFAHAAAIIARQRDDVDFVIVGEDKSGRGENRTHLENLISMLGLANRCRLAGWQEDIGNVLRGFEIFVSPSLSEPFGLVILEAMASGVPVIATSSEGALEIIENDVTGVLVPINDADLLAIAIMKLLDDPAAGKALASNASLAVNDRFSLERMVSETENLYSGILKETKKRRLSV